jgi:nitroreductase
VARRSYARQGKGNESARRIADAVQWQADHFEEVPVVVVACLRGSRPRFPAVAVASWYGSVFPAVQNLLLAARALGLGAALTTLPVWSVAMARRTLGLPAHLDRYGNRAFGAVARATTQGAE